MHFEPLFACSVRMITDAVIYLPASAHTRQCGRYELRLHTTALPAAGDILECPCVS